jgi:glutamyl-tRNA synthetase
MGWSMPDGREKFSFADQIQSFSWDRFSPVGPVFDIDKLDWLNGQYIQGLGDDEFLERIGPFLHVGADARKLRPLVNALRERTKRLVEIWDQVEFVYADDVTIDRTLLLKQGLDPATAVEALSSAERIIVETESFTPPALEAAFNAETERRGWKRRAFFMTIRVATTGRTVTPPLFETIVALGREATLARLQQARATLWPVEA